MTDDRYLDREEARFVLSDMGIKLTDRQMRRATEPDAKGRRKLPFFKDPITHRLLISEAKLKSVYMTAQSQAEKSALNSGC